ncbi:hypothetical protein BB560_003449, partial [Smittium megazygosporum]
MGTIPIIPNPRNLRKAATELKVYLKLEETLPSIKSDFFRPSLSEIDSKRYFGAYPRNKGIFYDPRLSNGISVSDYSKSIPRPSKRKISAREEQDSFADSLERKR